MEMSIEEQAEIRLALSSRQTTCLSLEDELERRKEALNVYSEVFRDGEVDRELLGHLVSALVKFQMEKIRGETIDESTKQFGMTDLGEGDRESFFLCELCSGVFVDPVTLTCGHTFCKLCIKDEFSSICKICGLENSEECSSANILLCNVITKWFPCSYELGCRKGLAYKLMMNGKLDEALVELSAILRANPQDLNCRCWRSDCFLNLGYPKIALKDIEVACLLRPNLARVLYRKAQIFLAMGNLEQVVGVLLRCCALEPSSTKLRSELEDVLHKVYKLDLTNLTDSILSTRLPGNFHKLCRTEFSDDSSICKDINMESFNDASACINSPSTAQEEKDAVFFCLNDQDSTTGITPKKRELLSSDSSETSSPLSPRTPKPEAKRLRQTSRIDSIPCEMLELYEINLDSTDTEQLDDFECKLCFNLMFDPVTSSCGHSFCKDCLYRSLDHRVECPCCRTALTKFLAERRQAVTVVLDRIIKELFPEEYEKRKTLHLAEMEELRRASEWSGHEIPVFVCTLALPFVQCPLHIFEPRYRLMIRRCIESGSRLFGMCPESDDPSKPISSYGTILKIKDVKYLQDGRSIISTVGTRRFHVQSYSMKDGYYVAKVKWIIDDPEEDAEELAEIQQRHNNGFAMLEIWFNGLSQEQMKCVIDAIGIMPRREEASRIGNDGPEWLWWALAALPLQDKPKLIILAMKSVVERLRSIQRFLMLMIKMQQRSNESK